MIVVPLKEGMPANCVWYKRKQTSLYPYRLIQKLEMRLPITCSSFMKKSLI